MLNIPIIIFNSGSSNTLENLKRKIYENSEEKDSTVSLLQFDSNIRFSLDIIEKNLSNIFTDVNIKWLAYELLRSDDIILDIKEFLEYDIREDNALFNTIKNERNKYEDINESLNIKIQDISKEIYNSL